METDISLKEKCRNYQKRRDYVVPTDNFIICHIDGRSFSNMIKNKFQQPFDECFIGMMNETAQYLCKNVQGTQLAYVQSDEITLIIKKVKEDGDIFFSGRLCKMQSVIASLATAKFNQLMTLYTMEYHPKINPKYTIENMALYQFDCKVWDVDNANDAMAWLLFRNIDCVRNSKQQTAQTYLPHKELLKKNADEQIALLEQEKGIRWGDLLMGEKYGRLIQKQMVTEVHNVNGNDVECLRSRWLVVDGFDLTNPENRDKIREMYPVFNEE